MYNRALFTEGLKIFTKHVLFLKDRLVDMVQVSHLFMRGCGRRSRQLL